MSGFSLKLKAPPKKYGLIQPAQPAQVQNVFQSQDEENSTVNQQLEREAEMRKKMTKTKQQYEEALAQDPTAFDYDGVYDQIQVVKGQEAAEIDAAKGRTTRKPRYIESMKNYAAERKMWQDIVYDRKLKKELEQEKGEFGDKPQFVTTGYKEKLKQEQKWLEEEEKRAALEEDVTKKEGLTNFYSGLLEHGISRYNVVALEKIAQKKAEEEKKKQEQQKEAEKERDAVASTTVKEQENISKEDLVKEEATYREKMEKKRLAEEAEIQRRKAIIEAEQKKKEEEEKTKEEERIKKLARKNDESSISEAKLRYLQRKAAREQSHSEEP